jgi:Protein of unknown function (DUF3352)
MLLSNFRRFVWSGVSLLALVLVPVLQAEDKESVPSDRLLPPGVLMHIRISDMTDLKERVPKTGFGKLYADESMDKVRAKIEEAFHKGAEEAGQELGFPLSDLLNLPTGEVTLAILQPAGRDLAGVVLMEIGEQQETLDKALAKLDEALTANGAKKKTETIEEVEVTIYELPKSGADESSEEKNTFCFFAEDGLFVGGSDLSVLQDVLDRWDGDSDDVLAEEEVYSYIREKCATREDDDSVVEWYIDPMGLIGAALNANEELAFQALMFQSNLPVTGFDKFKAIGGNMDLAEGGYDVHYRSLIFVEQPTTGVLRAMEFPATDLTPPTWVGASAPQYVAMNWDAPGAYSALVEMTNALAGPGVAEQQLDELAQRAGFHPKDDLIDHLDGQMVMLSDINPEAQEVAQKVLFAMKLKDKTKMQETLNVILEKAGSNVKEREFEGTKVYDIPSPTPEVAPAFAIAKDYFFISTHADMLEAALRPSSSGDETLAGSKSYQKLVKLMPAKNSMLNFSDMAKQLKPSYEMVKSGKLDAAFEGQFDSGILPDFEQISKFFSISGGYVIPDENGVFTESFMFGTDE